MAEATEATEEAMATQIVHSAPTDEPEEETEAQVDDTVELVVKDSAENEEEEKEKEEEPHWIKYDPNYEYDDHEAARRWIKIQERNKKYINDIGYNPADHRWSCYNPQEKDKIIDGFETCNIPDLQYHYHVTGKINDKSLVKMDGADSICPEPTPLKDTDPKIYSMIKYPPSTWRILTDATNIMEQFEKFDVNQDFFITEDEVNAYFKKYGNKTDMDQIRDKLSTGGYDKNEKKLIFEFKQLF